MSQSAPAIYSGFHLKKKQKKTKGMFHSLDLNEKMYFKVIFVLYCVNLLYVEKWGTFYNFTDY